MNEGYFLLTLAYWPYPSPSPRPSLGTESSAAFTFCQRCARSVTKPLAEGGGRSAEKP